MIERCRIRVVAHGRVQGVWFRASCASEARREGLGGWVRNRADGSVEAAFEGEATAVQRMVAWCRVGPPGADVTAVHAVEEPSEGAEAFEIRG